MRIKKILTEIKKGIVIGLLLTNFYGVGGYIYKSQNKSKTVTKTKKNSNIKKQNEENRKNAKGNYEVYGYKYKNEGSEESKFLKRNLGYEKRITEAVNKEEIYNKLKIEYCNAIKEIEKVDQEIVPGTNIPFKEATYRQVDDAYQEYLQKIAQIKNATIEKIDIESETKCHYESTKWEKVNNLDYRLKKFL